MSNAPRVISLYTGAGGLDIGFEAAGFEIRVCVDNDAKAVESLRRNRASWPIISKSIHEVTVEEILERASLKSGETDVLIGGPPCQPFSKAGFWTPKGASGLADKRADTLGAYLAVLENAQPRTFLLENVHGLIYQGHDEGMRHLIEGIARVNERTGSHYNPTWAIINAAVHGVPQRRERIFIVGASNGERFEFPEPTHAENETRDLFTRLQRYRTAWDAIGDLDVGRSRPELAMKGRWADLLPSIPEGKNYLELTERGKGPALFEWRSRYWNFLLKLAKNRPSWTIQAQPGPATGPFHWKNRRLSAHELARLQTFPDGYSWPSKIHDAQKLIGNAVPPLLAEIVARKIAVKLLHKYPTRTRPKLARESLDHMPGPEPAQNVPQRFIQAQNET